MAQWIHTWNGKRAIHKTKKAAVQHQKRVGGRVYKHKTTKARKDDMTKKMIRPIIGASFGIAALKMVT